MNGDYVIDEVHHIHFCRRGVSINRSLVWTVADSLLSYLQIFNFKEKIGIIIFWEKFGSAEPERLGRQVIILIVWIGNIQEIFC